MAESVTVPSCDATTFALVTGGVLGVVANAVDGQTWTTKTNSLNCTDAGSITSPTRRIVYPAGVVFGTVLTSRYGWA